MNKDITTTMHMNLESQMKETKNTGFALIAAVKESPAGNTRSQGLILTEIQQAQGTGTGFDRSSGGFNQSNLSLNLSLGQNIM